MKALITEKNKEIQGKIRNKEQLLSQNTELELEIKKHSHEIKELTNACKNSKHRVSIQLKIMFNKASIRKFLQPITQNSFN